MDIQKHERIGQIKRLSRVLFGLLTAVHYILFLGWPALLYVALQSDGILEIGEYSLSLTTISLQVKMLVLLLFAVGLLLMQVLNHYLRELLRSFTQGNVFNAKTLASVKGALHTGLLFFMVSLIHKFSGNYFAHAESAVVNFSFTKEILVAIVFFGLLYCLMWTLEIGADLREESDMTI